MIDIDYSKDAAGDQNVDVSLIFFSAIFISLLM